MKRETGAGYDQTPPRLYLDPTATRHRGMVCIAAVALGLAAVASMLMWVVVGWIGWVPSMIEMFGVTGLRIPAGIAIGGLLLAAVGLNEF